MSDPDEEWRDIPGWPGYLVSDQGRVSRLLSGKSRPPGSRYRYPTFSLRRERGGAQRAVHLHTLVLTAFIGPRPEGLEGRHLNGDQTDNRLANLAWGTRSENQQDRVAHGSYERTHCSHGHEFTPENTYVPKGKGLRSCRQCHADNQRDYVARKESSL